MISTAFALLLAALLPAGAFSPITNAVSAQPVPASVESPAAAASPGAVETPSAVPAASAPPPSASPGAGETSTPSPGASVPPSASPVSPVSPGASPTPAPEPTVDYGFRFVPHQPEHPAAGAPIIFAIYLNSNKLKSLGPIDIKVSTAPDVVKVFTHSNGRDSVIPMIAPGDFEALGKLPRLPFIASGITTTIDFVAVGANGKRVTVPVPVHLQ